MIQPIYVNTTVFLLLTIIGFGSRFAVTLVSEFLVLFLRHEGDIGPRVSHVVHGSPAPANPRLRVCVMSIGRCVVLPSHGMQNRSCWEDVRLVVCVG